MSSDANDFEALRKLMALKRHEQPPPEYLEQVTERIITRIEHGEGRLNLWDRLSASLSLRPTVAYAFGLTVCGALGLGEAYLVRQEMAESDSVTADAALKMPAPAAAFASQYKESPAPLHVANWLGNTNPALETQPELSLFGGNTHAVMPISYQTGR